MTDAPVGSEPPPAAAPGVGAPAPLRSLRGDVVWTLAGNVTYAAAQWLMLVLIARAGSPALLGRFALALATTTPVFMLLNLHLRSVQATDARRDFEFAHYLGLRLGTSAVALAIVAGLALAGGHDVETRVVILAVGAAKAVESLLDLFAGLLQRHERMGWVSRSLLLRAPLELLAMGVGLRLGGALVWGVLAMATTRLVVLLAHDVPAARRLPGDQGTTSLRPTFAPSVQLRLARLALPLGVAMMFLSLGTSIPRYVVERHLGAAQLGLFAAMATLAVPGAQVVIAMGQSASARLARLHAGGERRAFSALVCKLAGVAAALGVAGVALAALAGEVVLQLLYGAEYGSAPTVLVVLMISAAVTYVSSVLGFAVTATRRFDPSLSYALVATVAAVASATLIPALGLEGAAIATCLTALAGCATAVALLTLATHTPGPASADLTSGVAARRGDEA